MLNRRQSSTPWRGGMAAGLAFVALLAAGAMNPTAARSSPGEGQAQEEGACSRAEDSAPHPVDFKAQAARPYTAAEQACWIDWDSAKQLAERGAQWVDARETGAARRPRLIGALAVPRQEVADKAALRGLRLLILGEDADLRELSRQCVLWRQSGHFESVHIVTGGVRAWRLAGQPVQIDPQAASALLPPTVVSPAGYWQGRADGLWHVVTLGVTPGEARDVAVSAERVIPTADAGALQALRQALSAAKTDANSQPWLAVTVDAPSQARLQALWNAQTETAANDTPAKPGNQPPRLLWLDGGLAAYRDYLSGQKQLAAHAGQSLPHVCGM